MPLTPSPFPMPPTYIAAMANEFSSVDQLAEEEYIDMDMSSTTFLCYRISSPNHREFEFHLAANPAYKETTISPADELFYKGKLLPLHLPHRLQMVEKLIENSETAMYRFEKLATTATAAAMPFQSCNISTATSCFDSGELNMEDYYRKCAAFKSNQKKSWSKRLMVIGQSLLKLKVSKAYFKSLLSKNGDSEESTVATQTRKRKPFAQFQKKSNLSEDTNADALNVSIDGVELPDECSRRKSLSSVFYMNLTSKFSSETSICSVPSSSSVNRGPQMLKRCSSMSSEMENSVLGAIAYCKRSQQVYARKSASDITFCSL